MKYFTKAIWSFALFLMINGAWGQVSLTGTSYIQDFDGIGSGLPTGWSVRTGANASTLGSSATYTSTATSWNNTTGNFRNCASYDGSASGDDATTQESRTDRSLAVRQTAAFGDPGAAFVLHIANTTGRINFSLTFKLQSLDIGSTRTTTWRVDYGFGSSPTSFTAVATTPTSLTTGSSTFSSTNVSVNFGSALDNQSGEVWIRIMTLSSSSGSGNRPTTGIDDFELSWVNSTPSANFSFASSSPITVSETAGSVNVVVNQSSAAVCNVNVALVAGSAINGTHFNFTSPTTLSFDGVTTTQTINIPIFDNFTTEGSRTIVLELQSPTGSCSLGVVTTLIIFITDNELISPTTLQPGDILIVGVDARAGSCEANSNVDVIEWVCFKDITNGTVIDLTDNGYSESTGLWRNSEGTVRATYTGSLIPAGTKIVFKTQTSTSPTSDLPSAPDWTFSNLNFPSTSIALNTNGDQLYFMQGGTWNQGTAIGSADASYTGGRFLFAFSTNSAWNDFEIPPFSTDKSQHSSLYPNMRCFSAAPTSATDWSRYKGAITPATQRQWIDRVKNPSNWNSYTNCSAWAADPFPNVIIINSAPFVPGKWLGGTSTNWFDCNNWDDFRVPDNTIDVSIELTTGNNPTIDATAPFSDDFSDIAQARNLTLATTTNRTLTFPATGTHTLEVYGNWDNQKGESFFTEGNGTVRFRGGANQSITTSGGVERFRNIVFNKTSGTVTLNSTNVEVSGSATFTAGIVDAPNAATARMEFLAGSNYTGASAASHVQGWVRKVGNTIFTFPVGSGGVFAPASISAPSTATDHFTARYFNNSPHALYNTGSLLSPLKNVSVCEYWMIDRTNGSSNVNVTLSYDNPRSCLTPDPAGLVVARWNGTAWASEGQSAQTGTAASGTITSNVVTSFSPFTLGNITINPLPVELLSFRGFVTTKGEAQLVWQVAAQINIRGYAVEKSVDNKIFQEIGFVDAQNINTYNFFDSKFAGLSYYRLRIVEADGSSRFSQAISLDKSTPRRTELLIYPNPAGEQDEIKVMIGERNTNETLKTMVLSQSGKVLGEIVGNLEQNETYLSRLLAQQPKGMYIIYLHTENGETLTTKFVKR